jgi:hypothetical protein
VLTVPSLVNENEINNEVITGDDDETLETCCMGIPSMLQTE